MNASNFLTCLAGAGEIGSIFQIHDSMREIVLPFRIYFKSNLPESFLISSCLTTVQSLAVCFVYSTILLFYFNNTCLTTVRRLSFVNYFLAICSFSFAFPLFPALISRKELNNSLNNPSRAFSCIFLTSCKTFSF